MGLGKTVQAISLLAVRHEEQHCELIVLRVCALSVDGAGQNRASHLSPSCIAPREGLQPSTPHSGALLNAVQLGARACKLGTIPKCGHARWDGGGTKGAGPEVL